MMVCRSVAASPLTIAALFWHFTRRSFFIRSHFLETFVQRKFLWLAGRRNRVRLVFHFRQSRRDTAARGLGPVGHCGFRVRRLEVQRCRGCGAAGCAHQRDKIANDASQGVRLCGQLLAGGGAFFGACRRFLRQLLHLRDRIADLVQAARLLLASDLNLVY